MRGEEVATKELLGIYQPGSRHMVGDGFPVRNLFPSNDLDREVDPFLMLDYAGPQYFSATDTPRGVGEHPHRGFETVTLMYQGAVAHRDSAGHSGVIGPGDVQWMTAASGVVHEELHEPAFAKRGGSLQAVQLWVNLPRAYKMSAPRYQTILSRDIPSVEVAEQGGRLRVIAGSYEGRTGPAQTFTPVELYDLRLKKGARFALALPADHNAAILIMEGRVSVNGLREASEAELAVFKGEGSHATIGAHDDAALLIMSGKPIREPIARYGPFVMNTKAELLQAVQDYQGGKMGHLS
ncbi:MAG TPA: pirin family protein [Nitrospira sp.]|nr:pirin family protein [Nitrospira sp.]